MVQNRRAADHVYFYSTSGVLKLQASVMDTKSRSARPLGKRVHPSLVPPGGEHLHQDSVLVQESAMCVLDDQFVLRHGATSAPSSRHQSFVCGSPVAVPMRSTSSPCIRVEPRAQSVLGSNPRTPCH